MDEGILSTPGSPDETRIQLDLLTDAPHLFCCHTGTVFISTMGGIEDAAPPADWHINSGPRRPDPVHLETQGIPFQNTNAEDLIIAVRKGLQPVRREHPGSPGGSPTPFPKPPM